MTKTRQDKDMIDCTSTIYVKSDTELSWSIGSIVDYDENQIGK